MTILLTVGVIKQVSQMIFVEPLSQSVHKTMKNSSSGLKDLALPFFVKDSSD